MTQIPASERQNSSNFSMLVGYAPELAQLGARAEKYFSDDPNTCLIKTRQFAELLTQTIAAACGVFSTTSESQIDLLRRLQTEKILPRQVADVFHEIRKMGNRANHKLEGSHEDALSSIKMSWQLAVWFHRATRDTNFDHGPFIPPAAPVDSTQTLKDELSRLKSLLESKEIQNVDQSKSENEEKLQSLVNQPEPATETLLAEAEDKLKELQTKVEAAPPDERPNPTVLNEAAERIEMDEATTRSLIDQQLRDAEWEADTATLRHSKGTRPQRGRNIAIAEWPTSKGKADYILFVGLKPLAAIEAKKRNVDVSAYLERAKRYSREFEFDIDIVAPEGGPWGKEKEFNLPFGFSTNGRPYLKQHELRSGIWFQDFRRPTNHGRPLTAWHTPEGLSKLHECDFAEAETSLQKEDFNYDFSLRDYQQEAILSVEKAIIEGRREMLVAMATGTGKTKTAMAMMYRLLKSKLFKRVLFVVDRFALGEQAATEFKSTHIKDLKNFADIFGLKELHEGPPDRDTSVQIATVQGLIRQILYSDKPPAINQYDCIIVDECHRGYLLDKELSETELRFRDQLDYVSKYRAVLEYFDAVKIGLTATPALHTVNIFGHPIVNYNYRKAVIDGVLVDHDPPYIIKTHLFNEGIRWEVGDNLITYDPETSSLDHSLAEDELEFEVEDFNKKVLTENFNRVVCGVLAKEIDPSLPGKTLIFCATDAHCDLVVKILKEEIEKVYGEIDDETIVKITSKADDPISLIRKYRNETLPQFAVTVDLLTTGINVHEIVNIVFIRRVNSRILYEQMLGRATRLCDKINKTKFRIFDAVGIYEALKEVSDMKPVVVDPKISFSKLGKELQEIKDENHLNLARDQFIAKLHQRKRQLTEAELSKFETIAGQSPNHFIREMRKLSLPHIASWFLQRASITELLDGRRITKRPIQYISNHADELVSLTRGYGKGQKPEDYLEEFTQFIRENGNTLPAMQAVLQRPRDLTRKELKELIIALDEHGFSENNLESAWRDKTNQDIAARIIGYVRQAALGDPLLPWSQRVDNALIKLLSSNKWTGPQKQWLETIAAQTKANLVVDRDSIDDRNQIFKQNAGGFNSLDKKFDGKLNEILRKFNELIWNPDVA